MTSMFADPVSTISDIIDLSLPANWWVCTRLQPVGIKRRNSNDERDALQSTITLQHIAKMSLCCEVISSFCDICCFRSASGGGRP